MKEFFMSEMITWQAMIFILIALIGGFVIGSLRDSTQRSRKRQVKTLKRRLLERSKEDLTELVDELVDELNSKTRVTGKGVNIFTGRTFSYRVRFMYHIKYRGTDAIVDIYTGDGEQACEGGPNYQFTIDLESLDTESTYQDMFEYIARKLRTY